MEYSGEFTAENTESWLNKTDSAGNEYTGVYKFNPNILKENAYNTIKLKSGTKGVYVIVKYGEPTEAPDISDYEGQIETPNPNLPTDISGFALGSTADNTINVSFRETAEQSEKGQTYNIYVDGEKRLENVSAGSYTIDKVTAGRVTVKITAVLNNTETEGISQTIKVNGETYEKPTTKPEEPTTDDPDEPTTKPEESTSNEPDESTTAPVVTDKPTAAPTTAQPTTPKATTPKATTAAPKKTTAAKKVLKRTTVRKAYKKKASKKVKITFKRIKGAKKYTVQFSTTKKFKKILVRRTVKKVKITVTSKKLRNKKRLYVRVRAVGAKKWSKVKRVKIRKR